jgi:hypothetical protein
MTDWRSVAAAVDDTTAVLDSCSLKRERRASPSGAQNEITYICVAHSLPWNGGEVGDEGEESLEDLGLSIPCETPSFIVWMMAGIAERKTARSDEALVILGWVRVPRTSHMSELCPRGHARSAQGVSCDRRYRSLECNIATYGGGNGV